MKKSLSVLLKNNGWTKEQFMSLGEIEDLRIFPHLNYLDDGSLEIATIITYVTVNGEKGSLEGKPISSRMRAREYKRIKSENFSAFLEVAEELLGIKIQKSDIRHLNSSLVYMKGIYDLMVEHNDVFDLCEMHKEEDALYNLDIEKCLACCFEFKPWKWDRSKLREKLEEINLKNVTINFSLHIKRDTNVKWTHRCFVYVSANEVDEQLLLSFGCDFEWEDLKDGAMPLFDCSHTLFDKLCDEEALQDKIVAILKEQES